MLKFILFSFSIVSVSFIFLCNEQPEKKFILLSESNSEFKLTEFDTEKKITFIPRLFDSIPKEKEVPKFKLELKKYQKYEQKKDFEFNISLMNKNLNPIQKAKLIFSSNDQSYTTFSDEFGNAKINFQLEEIIDFIQLKVLASNTDLIQINLPLSYKIKNEYYLLKNVSEIFFDTNKDISDFETIFELKTNRFPKKNFATIAFEDSYPVQVDSDYNDYVAQLQFDEQMIANEIKSLEGNFLHVAKGSNYNHNLNFKFISNNFEKILDFNPSLELIRYNETNKEIEKFSKEINISDLTEGILIFQDSKKTISAKNTINGTNFIQGHRTFFKISFLKPIPREKIGFPPYDTYLKILTNSKNEETQIHNNFIKEIHLPNLYFDSSNIDLYIDSNRLPFAILIPETWSWQYEGKDITNERFTGYPDFNQFITSDGILYKDWYNNKLSEKVYPIPNMNTSLTAYIHGTDSGIDKFLTLGLVILLILILFYIRKKFLTA